MRKKLLSILLLLSLLAALLTVSAAAIDTTTRDTKGYDGEELPTAPVISGNIWTVTPENAQYTLDGAYGSISGKTIRFSSGPYTEVLVLGRVNKFSGSDTKYYSSNWTTELEYAELANNSANQYQRTLQNVTFTADDGVVLPGFTASSGHKYGENDSPSYDYVRERSTESTVNSHYAASIFKNIKFDGLTFSGGVIINDYLEQAGTDGITFRNCVFLGNKSTMATSGFCGIGMKADTKNFKNVTVTNCSFTNYYQGIYVQGPENWVIENCTFNNTTHNAIALQSSTSNKVTGTITVKENVIESAGDRAVRLGNAEDATIVLENNVMLNSGDDEGQLIKAGTLTSTTVTLNYNYWDGKEVATAVGSGLTQPTATGIHGGSFSEEIVEAYCAPGFVPDVLGDGTYGVKADASFFASGSGTQADPYVILTAEQLAAFRDSVNNGVTYAGQYIKLGGNITLTDSSWTPIGAGARSDSGYTGCAFKGTFDGGGSTITGLAIAADAAGAVDTAYGLFGVVDGGMVKNLSLSGVSINVTGGECVGGFIGLMVNNSTASGLTMGTGTISAVRGLGGIVGRMTVSGTIENCVNNAAISGSGANVGGIVGAAYYTELNSAMTIKNCVNHGTVTCTAGVTGGIAGLSAADVDGCENTADITGNGADVAGIVAEQQNAGSVTNCVNSGDIKNNASGAYGTGGIVGWVRYNGAVTNYGRKEIIEVTGNVNSGSVAGGNDGGGIVGTVYNAAVVTGNENTAPAISGTTFAAGIVGNLQFTETPVGGTIAEHAVTICHNVSTTSLDKISVSGSCKDLYVYNNGTTSDDKISDNGTSFVARVGTQKYTSLDAALLAVETSGGEVTLLSNAELPEACYFFGGPTTIYGNGFSVNVTVKTASGNTQAFILTDRSWALKSGSLTLDNVKMTIGRAEDDTSGGLRIGFDVTQSGGSKLTLRNGTEVTMDGLDRAFTTGTSLASVTIDNSTVTAKNISGNCSNGGTWDIKNGSKVSFEDCGNHALSTDVLKVSGSEVMVDGAGWLAIYASSIELNNAKVTVKNSATSEALASNSYAGKGAVQLKGKQSLTLVNSTLTLSGNGNNSEEGKQSIYVGGGTVSSTGSTINGDILTDAPAAGSYVVTCVSDGQVVALATVTDGNFTLPAAPSKAGYNFQGWKSGADGAVYAAGKQVAIAADTTFTAQWSKKSSGVVVPPPTAQPDEELSLPFVDVAEGQWFYEAVKYVYGAGLMDGVSATAFEPNSPITRGMIVTILWRLEGKPAAAGGGYFADVSAGSYYAEAIAWAAECGIVDGYGDGIFAPNRNISREELAAILYRCAAYTGVDVSRKADLSAYADAAEVSAWAADAMAWANAAGLITGQGEATLAPAATATRAEAAAILARYAAWR